MTQRKRDLRNNNNLDIDSNARQAMQMLHRENPWRILPDSYDNLEDAIVRLKDAASPHITDDEFKVQFKDFCDSVIEASNRYWVANGLSKKDYKNVVAYLNSFSEVFENPMAWQQDNILTAAADFKKPKDLGANTLAKTSNSKKILGVALIVLGVALLIATAAFCIATWGTLSPVAPFVGLGAKTLISTGIAVLGLSAVASSTVAVAGAGLGFLSLFKAKHCFKAGATKDIADAGTTFIDFLETRKPSNFSFSGSSS